MEHTGTAQPSLCAVEEVELPQRPLYCTTMSALKEVKVPHLTWATHSPQRLQTKDECHFDDKRSSGLVAVFVG